MTSPGNDSKLTGTPALSRRSFLAAVGALPVVASAAPAGAAVRTPSSADAVVIDLAAQRQTIRGFGGMNHPVWIDDLTPSQRETAFGNGSGQLGFSILRIPVSEDRANWARGLDTARRAVEHGGLVIAAPWNPPAELVETFHLVRKVGTGSTYQAEDGALTEARVADAADGHHGTGYVELLADSGARLEWPDVVIGSTGVKNLGIRYSLESGTRHLDLYVDGVRALEDVEFTATGSRSTWAVKDMLVELTAGAPSVALVSSGTGGPYIDSMNATGTVDDPEARRLRHDSYDEYARHLNDFTAFMRDNGVELYAISIQNEPDYGHGWTWWSDAEILRFMRENAGSIQTRVIAPESFQYVKGASDLILNDPRALANLDILGTHLYGTQLDNFPYPLFEEKGAGKELWMTEVYHPNSSDDADLWPQALAVGENIHHALVDGEFQAYVWWYIRRYYGPMKEDGKISKRGYNMAHYSKFVRPGHVRVDATSSPSPDVFTSAYRSDDGEVVIVAVNRGTTAVGQTFTVQNGPVTRVRSWVTDATRNLRPRPAIRAAGGRFTAELPAESVTSFVARRRGSEQAAT